MNLKSGTALSLTDSFKHFITDLVVNVLPVPYFEIFFIKKRNRLI